MLGADLYQLLVIGAHALIARNVVRNRHIEEQHQRTLVPGPAADEGERRQPHFNVGLAEYLESLAVFACSRRNYRREEDMALAAIACAERKNGQAGNAQAA